VLGHAHVNAHEWIVKTKQTNQPTNKKTEPYKQGHAPSRVHMAHTCTNCTFKHMYEDGHGFALTRKVASTELHVHGMDLK